MLFQNDSEKFPRWAGCVIPLLLGLSLGLSDRPALAGPREDFETQVINVRQNPSNNALRERVIAASQKLRPPPAIPTEARRHLARAQGALELSRTPEDMGAAIGELEQALLLAPWWAEGYYNLGVVQDKAGRYAEAARSMKLYLLAAPDAQDSGAVEMLIAKLEYKAEQSSPAAQAARSRQDFSTLLSSLNSAVFREQESGPIGVDEIRIVDGVAVYGTHVTDQAWLQEYWQLNPNVARSPFMELGRIRLTGFETYPFQSFICNIPPHPGEVEQPGRAILSPDGQKLSVRRPCPGKPDIVYLRYN